MTDPDPSAYYDELRTRPLTWDSSLGLWVATCADDVRAVLHHPVARVRPLDPPVPAALAGSAAGAVFGNLVRMHDRENRAAVKDAVAHALASLDDERVIAAVRTSAAGLSGIGRTGMFVDRWVTDLPLGAVADLIGIDRDDLAVAIEAGRHIAACFGPAPPDDAADLAEHAVAVLTGLVAGAATSGDGLAAVIGRALPDHRAEEAMANTIGLLFQTADATTGLCANGLRRLAGSRRPRPDELAAMVADTSVSDPAVHNTRRWFAQAAEIGGVSVAAGDAVLVVLAAAARNPGDGALAFGSGVHRCPAASLAPKIASLTIAALLDAWPEVLGEIRPTGFRPLPNVRIATFAEPGAEVFGQPGPGPSG